MELNVACSREGDAMNMAQTGTGFMPPITKRYMFSVHTVVLEGIAVFFCSTYSLPIPISPPICNFFFKTSASALQRVRFFVVGKRLFLSFFNPRAPPSGPGFQFLKISGLEENKVKIRYEFADGTVSEVEVEESIGAVIVEDRRLEDNLFRKERYHCYSLDAAQFEGAEYSDGATPESVLMSEESIGELQEALGSLTEVQKERIRRLADGLSINEIARQEGVAPNAVMKSIKSVREKLKKFFESRGV